MTQNSRQNLFVCLGLCLLAAGLLAWFDHAAIARVEAVSARYASAPEMDGESTTGYVDGKRYLAPLDHNTESFQWIAQAQLMAANDTWRLREVDYDNAPRTRPVLSPSPYRWWLASLGQWGASDEVPVGAAIERTLLTADVWLHWLLLVSAVALVAWRWGMFAAAVAALLLAVSYPVLSAFYPGSPNDRGLAALLVGWSVLGVLLGATGKRPVIGFSLGAIAAAGALWVDPNRMAPVVGGLALGGILAAWLARPRAAADQGETATDLPWRTWGAVGAVASLGVWLAENAPDRLGLSTEMLREVHPLYAVSWLGLGLLTARVAAGFTQGRSAWNVLGIGEAVLGLAAAAALPFTMIVTDQTGFMAGDAMSAQMSPIPGAERGASFADWLANEGVRMSFWSLALPIVGGLGAVGWLAWKRSLAPRQLQAVLLAALPLLCGVVMGIQQVSWWSTAGVLAALLLTGLAASAKTASSQRRLLIALGIALAPSLARVVPASLPAARETVTAAEQRTLAERDLAYWLSLRIDDYRSVALAPPESVPALYYFGGVRGLGSPYQGNQEGFGAAVRISSATSPDEAEALATQRELSHIILPTWDPFLDRYAQLGAAQVEHTLVALLHQWLPPRWLRAVHHPLVEVEGFEDQSVVIFEVVDVQDNATALSRLGEYFVETDQMQFALGIYRTLQQSFPSDLGGLVARAQIAVAMKDRREFEKIIQAILPYLEDARDVDLLWDRRVNLANLLMLAQETEWAREQTQFCMDEVDEYLLRTVNAPTLHRFIVLSEILDEPFPEDNLREAAVRLLTEELREQL